MSNKDDTYYEHEISIGFDTKAEAEAFKDRFFAWFTEQPEHADIGYSMKTTKHESKAI